MDLLKEHKEHEIYHYHREIIAFPTGAQVSCVVSFEGLQDVLDAIDNKECGCYDDI